jgi:hypothetical protein
MKTGENAARLGYLNRPVVEKSWHSKPETVEYSELIETYTRFQI